MPQLQLQERITDEAMRKISKNCALGEQIYVCVMHIAGILKREYYNMPLGNELMSFVRRCRNINLC
jgi:hypothetical protein